MVAQLALVGYTLTFLFGTDHPLVVLGTLAVMLGAAGWISLRPIARRRASIYPHSWPPSGPAACRPWPSSPRACWPPIRGTTRPS